MPKENNIGYGWTTADKQSGLESILHQQFSIMSQIEKKNDVKICYRHIDCCSGKGLNPEPVGIKDGSPLIFLKVAEEYNIRYTAHFIEMELDNYNQLHLTLDQYRPTVQHGQIEAIHGDYETELFRVINRFSPYSKHRNETYWQYGMAYFDPNSFPKWGVVEQFSRHSSARKIDILIHLSATSLKRTNCAFPDLYKLLDEYINRIDKTTWFIRDIVPGDAHQMTFLFGTNYKKYNAMASKRFYDIHSRMGQQIVAKLSLTREDYLSTTEAKGTLEGWGCK